MWIFSDVKHNSKSIGSVVFSLTYAHPVLIESCVTRTRIAPDAAPSIFESPFTVADAVNISCVRVQSRAIRTK